MYQTQIVQYPIDLVDISKAVWCIELEFHGHDAQYTALAEIVRSECVALGPASNGLLVTRPSNERYATTATADTV